jgi:transposase-like protein
MEFLMEQEMAKSQPMTDYQSYVIKRQLEDYWRADEKVQLIINGMHGKIPVTTLCKLNNVSPSLYYEWREKFLASGKEGMMANGGRSQREAELEKKIRVLERLIGELSLEKELLKKISDE